MPQIIPEAAVRRRAFWIEEIRKLSGNFANDFNRLEAELIVEIKGSGIPALMDHIRLCGNIPESYGHDSSEEKLYSKYTDALLALSFAQLGLESVVLKERADAADVEVVAKDYSFVADAKCFRLSRTAKNQKDFKVQAMDVWKRGRPYGMVVYPILKLPNSSSQIYQQVSSKNVCVFTYSHLSLLLMFSAIGGKDKARRLLRRIFRNNLVLKPSENGLDYWLNLNKAMLNYSDQMDWLWYSEKVASGEAVILAKEEGLTFRAQAREREMRAELLRCGG